MLSCPGEHFGLPHGLPATAREARYVHTPPLLSLLSLLCSLLSLASPVELGCYQCSNRAPRPAESRRHAKVRDRDFTSSPLISRVLPTEGFKFFFSRVVAVKQGARGGGGRAWRERVDVRSFWSYFEDACMHGMGQRDRGITRLVECVSFAGVVGRIASADICSEA